MDDSALRATLRRFMWGLCVVAIVPAADARAQRPSSDEDEVRVSLSLQPTYNRLEGLGITFGPVIETIEDNPLRLAPFLAVRTDANIPNELDRVGFLIRVEKFLGGGRRFRVGVGGWSVVDPIETRGLNNGEVSLATFVFHDDRRDYLERRGAALYARFTPDSLPVRAGLEFRFEDHDALPSGRPQTVFDDNEPWRPQPLIGNGTLATVVGTATLDTRPERRADPVDGWFVRLELTKGVGGDLVIPPVSDINEQPLAGERAADEQLLTGLLDVRRYLALQDVGVHLRVAAGGSLKGETLPPQFQHAPGGAGTVPGLDLLRMDCGARPDSVLPSADELPVPFFPYYGCDRFALFQAELQGYFGFRIGAGAPIRALEPLGLRIEFIPQWVVFFDAAEGWTLAEGGPFAATDADLRADVGAGILFGDIGFFAARALHEGEGGLHFVMRLGRRL